MTYSKAVRQAVISPRNGPKYYNYNGIGENIVSEPCKTNPSKKLRNKIIFKVCVREGVVQESRWEVFGDPVAIAACMWCRDQIDGAKISELNRKLILEQMLLDLEVTNSYDIKSGCIPALETVAKAIDNYQEHNPPL